MDMIKALALSGALLALPLTASAATITVGQQSTSVFGTNGSVAATIDGPLGGPQYVGVGGLDLSVTGVVSGVSPIAGDFVGWCVDIASTLSLAHNYDVPDAPGYIGLDRIKNIERLFETAYSTLDRTSNAQSAGFQMALWELVYEDLSSSFDLNVGDFLVSTGSAASVAARTFGQNLLANLMGARNTDYGLVFLTANPAGGTQNLVTIVEGGGVLPPIPLPAAGWMLLLGLGGLAAMRRKTTG